MKISELPADVREKALKYQAEDKGSYKTTDDLISAFNWADTIEGFDYWDGWDCKEYSPFQEISTLRLETPDND